jgi:hypothetical protein
MPSTLQHVALVAHDAGGARALLPVAAELQRRGTAISAIAAGPAAKIWREEMAGVALQVVEDGISAEVLAASLEDSQAEALLSASGLYNRIEHRARRAARHLGLPVVALLDSWWNEAERFEREENGTLTSSRPDRVCAIDSRTRASLLTAGFDESAVVITGHPDLEKTAADCAGGSGEGRGVGRRSLGIDEDALVVLFFSDPFEIGPGGQFYSGLGGLVHPDGRPVFGYTTRDILPAVMEALEAAMVAENASCELIVRPHPSEYAGALEQILRDAAQRRVRARLVLDGTPVHWIRSADVVMGMMTIALLHGALGGRPALSVQIGLRESGQSDPCVSNTLGYTRGIFDRESLQSVCRQVARREWAPLQAKPLDPIPLSGAAQGVADVLFQTACGVVTPAC